MAVRWSEREKITIMSQQTYVIEGRGPGAKVLVLADRIGDTPYLFTYVDPVNTLEDVNAVITIPDHRSADVIIHDLELDNSSDITIVRNSANLRNVWIQRGMEC